MASITIKISDEMAEAMKLFLDAANARTDVEVPANLDEADLVGHALATYFQQNGPFLDEEKQDQLHELSIALRKRYDNVTEETPYRAFEIVARED